MYGKNVMIYFLSNVHGLLTAKGEEGKMYALLSQTRSNHSASYLLERDGQALATAEAPFSPSAPEIVLFRQGELWMRLVPDLRSSFQKTAGKGRWQTAPWKIFGRTGEAAGSLARIRVGNLFSAYFYTELRLQGRVLQAYEIGLGKEGMRYPLYEGDVQLAQVEKDPAVRDNLDAYRLYSLDTFGELAAVLFSLYLDYQDFRSAGEYARGKRSVQYVYTRRKELLARFDPDFRSRCASD